jgi:hypothetical protein
MTNSQIEKAKLFGRSIRSDDLRYLNWTKLALAYLILTGILGALMRLAFVVELPLFVNYKYILHTHSHVGIMGWIFSGLYIFILKYFDLNQKVFQRIFWMIQVCIVGMVISFPLQGYGLISIFFTSMHMFLSYAFIYYTYRDFKNRALSGAAVVLLKTAMIFLFISTLGTWALGFIMNSSYKGSPIYYASIQFFLHFQFNGWFIFAILAIISKIFEKEITSIPYILKRNFYWLLVWSCIFTYTLAVTWSTPIFLLFMANSFGVILQFGALVLLYFFYKRIKTSIHDYLPPIAYNMWKLAAICFTLKIGMQTLVAIPYLATISYTIKNFVIGFIHLLMLGTLTAFIIGCIHLMVSFKSKGQKIGLVIFILGFVVVEILLFLQGLMLWIGLGFIPNYYLFLFIFSVLMPTGILIYTLQLKIIPETDL